jgi:hypothetical protein
VPGRHHPLGAIEHHTEVVRPPQLRLAGRQPHPHRQLQLKLRSHRRLDRRFWRGERCAHPVTGVLEQPAPVRLHRPAQDLVVRGESQLHPIGVGLPPTRRTLDIGEQKRHHPRRRPPRVRGHTHRISQERRPA